MTVTHILVTNMMLLRRVLVESSVVCQRIALFVFVLVCKDASSTRPPPPARIPSVTRAPSQNTADKFTIFDPRVRCDDDSHKQYWCDKRNANNDRTHGSCKCVCRWNFLTFLPNLQICVGNREVYSLLGDCSKRTQDQTGYPPLAVVSDGRDAATPLWFAVAPRPLPSRYVVYSSTEICTVNHENSFYRVHGQWKPITKGVFVLRRINSQLSSTKTVLQWSDNVPSLYSGRIIRLDFVNCSELWHNNVRRPAGCLLLKVAGTISESITPSASKLALNSGSPTNVPSNGTDRITRSWIPAAIRPSNVHVTLSNKASAVPFTAQRGVASSICSTAYEPSTTTTNTQIVPEHSLIRPHVRGGDVELSASSSPPPGGRHGAGTRDHNGLAAVTAGGATTGGLVILIFVVVLVKIFQRKRRSNYSVNEGAATEANCLGSEEVVHHSATVGSAETSRATSMPLHSVREGPAESLQQSVHAGDGGEKKYSEPSREHDRAHYEAEIKLPVAPISRFAEENLAYETTDIINRLHELKPPAEYPEYDVLEEPATPCIEGPHSEEHDDLVLGAPEYHVLEGPTAAQPDYDVLEGPDSESPSRVYGSLVGRTTETYAALRRH